MPNLVQMAMVDESNGEALAVDMVNRVIWRRRAGNTIPDFHVLSLPASMFYCGDIQMQVYPVERVWSPMRWEFKEVGHRVSLFTQVAKTGKTPTVNNPLMCFVPPSTVDEYQVPRGQESKP